MRHRTKFRKDRSYRSGGMADFRFFNMEAAAILDFGNFKFLTAVTLMRDELRLHAKFCRNRSNRGWDMAIFRFFKMAAVRHLGFSKVGNFNCRFRLEAGCASSCQISRRSVEAFQRYGRFSIFKDGGCRHLAFSKFQIFNSWDAQEGVKAAVLKQQVSKFYLQIQRTEASDHIYFSQRPVIIVKAIFCA